MRINIFIICQLLCLGLRAQYSEFNLPNDQKYDCSLSLNDSILLVGGSSCSTYRPSSVSDYKGVLCVVLVKSGKATIQKELILPRETIRVAKLIQHPVTQSVFVIAEIMENGFIVPYIEEFSSTLDFVGGYKPSFPKGFNYEIQLIQVRNNEYIVGYCMLNDQGNPYALQLAKLDYDGLIMGTVTVSDTLFPRFFGSICEGFNANQLLITRLGPAGDEIYLIDSTFQVKYIKTTYHYKFDGQKSYSFYNSIGSVVKNNKYYLSLHYVYLKFSPRVENHHGKILVFDQNFDTLKTITYFGEDNRRFHNSGFTVDDLGNIYNTGYYDDQGYYPQFGETNAIHCSKINPEDEMEWIVNFPIENAAVDTYSNFMFRANTLGCVGSAYMKDRTQYNDPFLFFISNSGEVGINEHYSSKGAVYPNPCTSILTILGEPNGTQITVYAVTGQVAAIKQISNSSIDISDLPDGFYTILSKNKVVKIVKSN